MIKNWKLTARLISPLAGEAPKLDAVLQYELASRLGFLSGTKTTRNSNLSDLPDVPIPVAKRTINGVDVYCTSDPIISEPWAEWSDYINKRIDTSDIALALAPEHRKSLLVASGPYKMRHAPCRVIGVDSVVWFIRCARLETNKLLKQVKFLGKHRNIGYGMIKEWIWEEVEEDWSITALCRGKPVLMRSVPIGPDIDGVTGFKKSFGSARPPYWHPETYREIAVPC